MFRHKRLGADPELFLVDHQGQFVSAIGHFGGTKASPKPIQGFINGYSVQEDNVAVEFNIPPTAQKRTFVKSIHSVLNYLSEVADKINLKLAIVPSAVFDEEQLQHPNAKVFGCDRDFNVWSLTFNPPPYAKNKQLRSAGGHIHIETSEDRIGLGRACDLFLGCSSVAFDPDTRRRELYGKAGSVRDKSYGLEYRTLSNFWLKSQALTEWAYDQAQRAAEFVSKAQSIPDDDARKIITCINNADQELLRDLSKKYKLAY